LVSEAELTVKPQINSHGFAAAGPISYTAGSLTIPGARDRQNVCRVNTHSIYISVIAISPTKCTFIYKKHYKVYLKRLIKTPTYVSAFLGSHI
jgi:hypothetical protein